MTREEFKRHGVMYKFGGSWDKNYQNDKNVIQILILQEGW